MDINNLQRTLPQSYHVDAGRIRVRRNYADQMCNMVPATQASGGTFELHISNDKDGKAIGSMCGADYSLTVYQPKDFDPANPVYKVKVWDKGGNVTERMVDVSKVDTAGSDYIDMGDYYSSSSAASSGGGGGWFGGNYGMYGQSGAGGSGYVDGVAPFTHNGKYYPAETEAGVNEGNGRAFIRYVECA